MKVQEPVRISQVEITPFRPRNGHLGFASLVISDALYISDLAIFARAHGGLRIGYPKKTLNDGTSVDIVKPLTDEIDQIIEDAITERYEFLMRNKSNVVKENGNEPTKESVAST